MRFDESHLAMAAGADPVIDCLWQASLHHLQARASALRARLQAAVSDRILVEAHVFAAQVHFGSRLFHLDEEGTWAVLAPMTDEMGWIVDIAAFEARGPRVARLNGEGIAVGLEELRDCWIGAEHLRPRIHGDIWSWLKAECCGVLPVDWRASALYLMERRVDSVLAGDLACARRIARQLAAALAPPPVFVAGVEVAA